MRTPLRPVGSIRLSDLRAADLDEAGESPSLDDQQARMIEHCRRIGWPAPEIVIENDLDGNGHVKNASAFKRHRVTLPNGRSIMRTKRPKFAELLVALETGRYDGYVALDLDRAVRDPRDLEDLIDVVEFSKIAVTSVSGSLRLESDADITMARVMVAVANKESRDKSRRVTAAYERRVREGKAGGGGRRCFGWERDGVTIAEDEAQEIRNATEAIITGAQMRSLGITKGAPSLRSLAADLRKRGVPTVTGAQWLPVVLQRMLLRPRNAGIMVYRGEEIGKAPWAPIVPEETFRRVVEVLKDPGRCTTPGPAPRSIGSSIYRCGVCGEPCTVRCRGRYCCPSAHVARQVNQVDHLVVSTLLARLGEPDAADLFAAPTRPDIDVVSLRAEALTVRSGLAALAEDRAMGVIDRTQLAAGTAKGRARLEAIEAALRSAITVKSPVDTLVGADPARLRARWNDCSLTERRLVIDSMLTVRILKTGRGSRFNPEHVAISFRRDAA